MVRILGIDPGSQITGYGIVDVEGNRCVYVSSGCVRVSGKQLPERLKMIFEGVTQIITQFQPQEMAIENVFMHRNADSALKLGQARGAAICAGVALQLSVAEYTARQVKQATVGKGNALKQQVQHMVTVLLNLSSQPPSDAADALAVALCHSHTRQTLQSLPSVKSIRCGRLR